MSDYSFSGLARGVVEQLLGDLHTCLPARIISLSADSQKATVQPLIKARYTDADGSDLGLQEMASIPNVQLFTIGSDNATITFPVKQGSMVLVFFSERSLDNFSYSDGKSPVDPADLRMHDYNDAFAICCGNLTFPTALGIHPEDTIIRMNVGEGEESTISLKPDGHIVIKTPTRITLDAPNIKADGEFRVTGNIFAERNVSVGAGATGTFTTPTGDTVSVVNGIVTNIF